MSTERVTLPDQSRSSQMADAAFLMALLFLTLFVTTYVFTDSGAGTGSTAEVTAIEELPISEAEKRQFTAMEEKDMVDAETVAASVAANAPSDDKYSFSWTGLLGTIALAVAYLWFVYAMSFKEYREVVRARFGAPERSRP